MHDEYVLAVPPDSRRWLAIAWLWLGIMALLGSGVFSVLLVLSRTPYIQDVFPWIDFFRTALVVHVDLSVLVWIRVQLKRYPITGSAQERSVVILELNSDDFDASEQFQTQSVPAGDVVIDFARFVYYVDAQLINKQDPSILPVLPQRSVSPAIGNVGICRTREG
jgi:hypothetical protein